MIRDKDNCWIKIEPTRRKSKPSILYIVLNKEEYCFDVYDENGIESQIIYFKGDDVTPSFYLKSENNFFRIDFENNDINIIPITEKHQMKSFINDNCSCFSSSSSCWSVTKYFTSRPEKPPFDEM